jgi:hypothetical protein
VATFRGTFGDFYQWADPRTRFWITKETRGKKRKVSSCPGCGKVGVALTSAHVTPRKDVIRKAVGAQHDSDEIELDLTDAWAKIKAAHRPFEIVFRYLCSDCHATEDGKGPPET